MNQLLTLATRRRLIRLGMVGLPFAILILAIWSHRWVTEDGFINFRVARNLAHGNGFVFNPGERVEVGTSPLWIFVLTAAEFLPGNVSLEWWSVIGGLVFTIAGLALTTRASIRFWNHTSASTYQFPLGLWILCGLVPVWDFSTSGLEGGLGTLWLGASFALGVSIVLRKQFGWSHYALAAVVSLGTLVRPDFGIFALPLTIALIWDARRQRPKVICCCWNGYGAFCHPDSLRDISHGLFRRPCS